MTTKIMMNQTVWTLIPSAIAICKSVDLLRHITLAENAAVVADENNNTQVSFTDNSDTGKRKTLRRNIFMMILLGVHLPELVSGSLVVRKYFLCFARECSSISSS